MSEQGCPGKIRTRGALFSVKNSIVLNANNPQHLNREKLNLSGFSQLHYVLQRLLQAYFQFQDISLCKAWAIYDLRDHFMRPAGTNRNINTYRESSQGPFFALSSSNQCGPNIGS